MNYYQKKCDGINHTVKPGDTLYRLSRIYGVPLGKIMDANPEVNVYNLKVGTLLCIPMEMKPGQKPLPDQDTGENNIQIPGQSPNGEKPGNWQTGAGLDWMVIMPYKIKAGDNLNSILRDFDMDFQTFADYNPRLMPISLPEGETVYVKRRRILADGRENN